MSQAQQPEAGPRPSRTLRGWLIRAAAVLLVLVLGGWLIRGAFDGHSWRRFAPRWLGPSEPPADRGIQSGGPSLASAAALSSPAADVLAKVEPSVVLIEADGPGGLSVVGTGFVVDSVGRIATSFHVAAEATAGVARFRGGAVYEIAGYAAIDRDNDLAILQLRGAPQLVPLALATGDPAPLSPVFALGHPQGVQFSPFDGKVSRLIRTSELPAATQRFVRDLTGSRQDHLWIQHTATLSDGNSGGPLINQAGEALGINTWTDRQTGFGYTLHARQIDALLDDPPHGLEPLERHATSDARLRSQLWQTSARQLADLHAEARAMEWRPASREDYARLQKLAWAVTIANRPDLFAARAALGDRLDDLVREADRVVAQLKREKWNDIGQVTLLNEHAAEEISRPLAGLVFFGTIDRVALGSRGEQAAIMRLAGFEARLLVPLEGKLAPPRAGAQCLVVGVNDRGKTVQYGDNPLDPIVAPVVIAPVVMVLDP